MASAPTLPPLPPITSLGSGSNLDLQGILDKMQASAKQQLAVIQKRQTQVATQISAYGSLQSAIQGLQTAAQALSNPATYAAISTSVTGDGFSATAAAGAVPGQYSIKVDALASAEQLKSGSIVDRKAAIGSGGTITITLGDGSTHDVAVGSDSSLNGIVKAINADDASGVQAAVINDGNGNSYLMLTSKDTGTQAAVTQVTVSGNNALQGAIGYDGMDAAASAMTRQHQATDAKVEINGVMVTSGSNVVDSSIDNITLTLTAVSKDDTGSVRVTSDTSATLRAVQGFINAYNTLQTQLTSLTAFDAGTKSAGVLTGDGTIRSIQAALSSALRVLTGGNRQTIQDLGISTTPARIASSDGSSVPPGGLVLNLDKLDATHLHSFNDALKKNPADVGNVLKALGTQIANVTSGLAGKNGTIANRTAGLNTVADTLQDNYQTTEARINADIANVRAQFVRLDALVAQMNGTSSYLTQQFEALSSNNR